MTNKELSVAEQANAVKTLYKYITEDDIKIVGLFGRAGTGKTTCSVQLIKELQKEYSFTVALATVSHKAKQVIEDKFNENKIKFSSFTIASLLNLKRVINNKLKKVEFVYENSKSKLNNYDIVIIDECSQINNEYYDLLTKNIKNTILIFMGDIYQTPPINDDIIFSKSVPDSKTFDIPHKVFLKTPYRYEGAIMELAEDIRLEIDKCNNNEETSYQFFAKHINHKDICVYNDYSFIKQFKDCISYGSTFPTIICYRNERVSYINSLVRAYLFGEQAEKEYIINEILVSKSNVYKKNNYAQQLLVKNMVFYRVQSVETVMLNVYIKSFNNTYGYHISPNKIVKAGYSKPFYLKCYKLTVKEWDTDSNIIAEVLVISKDSKEAYSYICKSLSKLAEKNNKWEQYFQFKDEFANFEQGYAINTYVAQGSTYNEVIVDVKDITTVSLIDTKQKLQSIYTAVTRAKSKVTLLNIKSQ